MATTQHRCVFVGNIPYDATEEQLMEICQEVGPVVSFRLVTDRETGKPKGYGFCEYKDEETALSARRNLQGYEINGRQLRVDFAENDKGSDRSREQRLFSLKRALQAIQGASVNNIDYSVVNSDAILGRGGPGLATNADHQKQAAAVVHGDDASSRPIGLQTATAAAAVMTGALGGPQVGSMLNQNGFQSQSTPSGNPLTLYLANLTRNQLNEVLSELKGFATRNKVSAWQLLNSRPQLAKALFQAEIMLGMVTPQVLQMPDVRQSAQTAIVESQVMQQAALSVSSRLSPHAHRLDSAALTDIHGQMPTVAQGSFVPSQFSRSSQPPVQQQFQLIPRRNFQQGQISGVNIGKASQIDLESKPVLTSLLPHPLGIDPHFQIGPSGVSDGLYNNAGLDQVTLDTSASTSNQYATTNVGFLSQCSRPSKLIKLEDGRGSSLSVRGVDGNAGIVPSQFGTTQAVPDADTSLLQQVLSLTAEQLSTLPLEQRQQVLQLQQKLRQDYQMIAD